MLTFSLTLAVIAEGALVCRDHDEVVSAVAAQMNYADIDGCSKMAYFCAVTDPWPTTAAAAIAVISDRQQVPNVDDDMIAHFTNKAHELAAQNLFTMDRVTALVCPTTCNAQCDFGYTHSVTRSAPAPCHDHNNLVSIVGAGFGMSSCDQVKGFCANPMTIPTALIDQDLGDAVPATLQAKLDVMKAAAAGVKLSDVLGLVCPVTCEAMCDLPATTPPTPAPCHDHNNLV